ncbi:MPN256 family protein [Mycoplasmoides pneumoniae]|uniref:Uncharacterized protein n=1 Tax=Mycoplasmoides pneumoniae 309 TaxID=1112856 RepID=A0AB33HLR5_MYCPM|nr:hypothetical protein [Mycoplasmoides pneumoniae]ARQ34404.1 hypothetical protein BIX53_01405 [Mycoplasmoides pneumoniae]ARQ41488.1 hypothetical protein BIX61_01415 [Mycoplasmoides pneumoniae]ARQ43615.1 hypothetical protein BIY07_01410 [Mycoplasmoides pneumoniae]QHR08020.1 hypothetical protein FA925_01395 [Mycoplasmoides pneumoniae]QHR10123.1 hypothetical protein FA928_01395 [Mycoplasmoides pneumoniae]
MDRKIVQLIHNFSGTEKLKAAVFSHDEQCFFDFVSFDELNNKLTGFLLFDSLEKLFKLVETIQQKRSWLYVDELWLINTATDNQQLNEVSVWLVKKELAQVGVLTQLDTSLVKLLMASKNIDSALYNTYIKPVELQQFTQTPAPDNVNAEQSHLTLESTTDLNNSQLANTPALWEVEQTTQELLPTMDFSKFIDELDQITKNFSDLELEPLSFNEGFDEWNQE